MIELDLICKRYSKLPSDILKLDITDFQFNQLVYFHGIKEENKRVK